MARAPARMRSTHAARPSVCHVADSGLFKHNPATTEDQAHTHGNHLAHVLYTRQPPTTDLVADRELASKHLAHVHRHGAAGCFLGVAH